MPRMANACRGKYGPSAPILQSAPVQTREAGVNDDDLASGDRRHIGFRVGDELAAEISKALRRAGVKEFRLVADAIRSGLKSMLSDAKPSIRPAASVAGPSQFRVQLRDAEVSQVDALRTRVTHTTDRPVPRVFVLRECLFRGLDTEPTRER
jgi:hypothetical protein